MISSNPGNTAPGGIASAIIKTGLLAGTLDICSAFLYSYIKNEVLPQKVLQYISKVAFGKTTFTDPFISGLTGLLVHFAIAMSWTILFFILYPKLKLIRLNRIITGILYGLLVWVMMNVLILPWWNNRSFVFKPEPAIINALILVVSIGMPLSFMAHSYYSKKGNSWA